MPSFVVHGGRPLRGQVKISGSKNAALPILAATLLTDKLCVIKNVPDIEDVYTMLSILKSLGSEFEFKNNTVKIQTKKIKHEKIAQSMTCKMRASVLLLGPLLAKTGYAKLPYPGGCVLGARPVDTHINVLKQFGIKENDKKDEIVLTGKPKFADIVLPEFSVTATENAVMAAALTGGKTTIKLAALEPHVQDLCVFIGKMGVSIKGIGTHTITVNGKKKLHGAIHSITPDYLEAGTFAIAAAVTGGDVILRNIAVSDLDTMWNLMKEMGIKFKFGKNNVHVLPCSKIIACKRLQTNVFPGFPTDLQPPFAVLLTQAAGKSKIHETLFEGRFKYFDELKKMGAKITTLNPHEAIVEGAVKLMPREIQSWDIRAGAAMILAALAAKGESIVTDIHYIDRGYENLEEKLRKLGADIRRVD